jgi:hypothetical protein
LTVRVFEKSRGIGGRLAQRRLDDASFDLGAQYCTAREPEFVAQLALWAQSGVAVPWRARLGSWRGGELTAFDDDQLRWVGTPAMSSMVRALAAGLDVHCGVRVAPLSGAHAPWALFDDQGRALGDFAAVICTAPSAQSAELLAEHAPAVELTRSVPLAPCFALGVQLDHAAPECAFDGIFADGKVLSWLARDGSKPSRHSTGTWMAHAAPQWSAAWLEQPADAIEQELLKAFFTQSGVHPSTPQLTSLHRWRYAQAPTPLNMGGWFDPDRGLGMAGDWLAGNRVEGAWCSGLWAARQVIAAM